MIESNKLVSIREAIIQALEMMGKDDMREAPILNIWATRAENEIGSYYGYEKSIEVINVKGCRAELPCGTHRVLGVLIGDQGTSCDLIFDSICNLNVNTIDYQSLDTGIGLTIVGGSREVIKKATYEVREDNCIEFPYNINSDKVTVKVLKNPTDSKGFIKVQYSHIEAIAAYIKWKIAERSRFGPDKMTLGDVQYFSKEWSILCRKAIGNSAWPSETEMQELSGIINNPLLSNVYHLSENLY